MTNEPNEVLDELVVENPNDFPIWCVPLGRQLEAGEVTPITPEQFAVLDGGPGVFVVAARAAECTGNCAKHCPKD
jgi:hypothetical protein